MSDDKPKIKRRPSNRGLYGSQYEKRVPYDRPKIIAERKEAAEADKKKRASKAAHKTWATRRANKATAEAAARIAEAETAVDKLVGDKPPTQDELRGAVLLLAVKKARENFLEFIKFMMPDPDQSDDPAATRYVVKPHHRLIAEIMQEVEAGKRLRQTFSIPPQTGKSAAISRMFPAWYMGRNPHRNLMFGTYSQDRANDEGSQVRAIMQSTRYRQVFPDVALRSDSKAKDHMKTVQGGQMSFIGRGGAGTGKPADLFIIDDPIKDDQEAQSDTIRELVYQWFTKVAYTRCHSLSAIVIVHTIWNGDDLICRLVDPEHPKHDKAIAAKWRSVNIPAVIRPGKLADALGIECRAPTDSAVIEAFGSEPISALWPERFDLEHLATAFKLNPSGFNCLYMGSPTPDDGDFFKREYFRPYTYGELPANLKMYGASDHAVTQKQSNDPSCLGCVGVDDKGEIWVLPDLVWAHMETDRVVDEMIALMQRHKPMLWWAEGDIINKAIGPFLRKQMRERKVYATHVMSLPISGDKKMRARSVQGMAQLGMIHVPAFAPWWPKALAELLKFPNGVHDDFVDWLAWIGRGLDHEFTAGKPAAEPKPEFVSGTLAWIKKSAAATGRRANMAARTAGW